MGCKENCMAKCQVTLQKLGGIDFDKEDFRNAFEGFYYDTDLYSSRRERVWQNTIKNLKQNHRGEVLSHSIGACILKMAHSTMAWI